MAVLLWTNQIQKFVDFTENNIQTIGKMGDICIFGEELKVAEYNRLYHLSLDKIDILPAVGSERETLMFYLGKAYSSNIKTIYVISAIDGDIVAFANLYGIEIMNLLPVAKTDVKSSKNTRNTKRTKNTVKATSDTSNAGQESEKATKSRKKSCPVSEMLSNLVLEAERCTGNAYQGRLDEIAKGILNASDENIGFPFQMQMIFGKEKGDALSKFLTPHFAELRKAVTE